MTTPLNTLGDDFSKEPPYPPDFLLSSAEWSGVGDLEAYRGLERRLTREGLLPLAYLRLHQRLGFALLTADMQNRWKRAYQQALTTNQRALGLVASLARHLKGSPPLLLLQAAAHLCCVHEDAGTRPCDQVTLLVGEASMEQAARHLVGQGLEQGEQSAAKRVLRTPDSTLTCTLLSSLKSTGGQLDAHGLRERAVRPRLAEAVVMADVAPLEYVAAIDLHAQADSVAMVPTSMRPAERAEAATMGVLMELPNLLVPAPHDLLLLAIADDVERGSTSGLLCWEQAQMVRLPGFDAAQLAREAARSGLGAAAHLRLAHLQAAWKAPAPAEALEQTRLSGWQRFVLGAPQPASAAEAVALQKLALGPAAALAYRLFGR